MAAQRLVLEYLPDTETFNGLPHLFEVRTDDTPPDTTPAPSGTLQFVPDEKFGGDGYYEELIRGLRGATKTASAEHPVHFYTVDFDG